MGDIYIGKKIAKYRTIKGLTIRDLAKLTGVSSSLLSQLERGIGNPTLSVLKAIAFVLKVPLFLLLMGEIDNGSLILRKEHRKKIPDENTEKIVYDILTPSALKSNIELFLMSLKPFSETSQEFIEHDIEETAFVIEGQTYLLFEHEEFMLREGDTVRILANRKHKFKNIEEKEAKILFVKSKLSF